MTVAESNTISCKIIKTKLKSYKSLECTVKCIIVMIICEMNAKQETHKFGY